MYKKLIATLALIVAPLVFATNVSAQVPSLRFNNPVLSQFAQTIVNLATPTPSSNPSSTPAPVSSATPSPTITPTQTPSPTSTPLPYQEPQIQEEVTQPVQQQTALATNTFNRALLTLTLDDASKTEFVNGWPLMKKYGIRGTFYIVTGSLDGNWFMTPEQVKTLKNAGNHIGAHTVNHLDLTTLSPDQVDFELSQSQVYLQNLLGVSIRDFATPYGAYNPEVVAQISKYFRSHRTSEYGFNTKSNFNSMNLLVQYVKSNTTANQIVKWINQAKRDKSWLILVYHEIKSRPDEWGTTPTRFENQLKAIKNSGIPVVTLDQALNELLPQL